MAFNFRRIHGPQWLSGGAHALILYGAAEAETAAAWPWALLGMAVVSFCAWLANHRRYRQIHDLPTSRVASAAQGYVELFGRADLLPGEPIRSRLGREPCCWYAFEIEERDSKDNWRTVESGRSSELFLLIDDTGQCVVSPEGAEVLCSHSRQWQEGRQRLNEDLLLPRSRLYALGEFSTQSAAAAAATDERDDMNALLNEWKSDRRKMLERFDLDRDGQLDLKEWELARLQAQREIRRQRTAIDVKPVEGVHLLRKPADGRLFLLAAEMPDKLGGRYRLWSWVHLAIFIGAGIAGLVML